jgi:pectinesterase
MVVRAVRPAVRGSNARIADALRIKSRVAVFALWTGTSACAGGDRASNVGSPSDGGTGTLDGNGADVTDEPIGDAAPTTSACTGAVSPQLTDAQAADDTALKYLAQAGILVIGLTPDNWDPTAGVGDVNTFTPTYTVAPTGGTHTTIQAAIDAAVQQGGTNRTYILVSPGTYREVVCVPSGAPPITLYGSSSDASQTVVVYDNYAGETKATGTSANPCTANAAATTYGTAGSATFSAFANGFQAENITFANDVTAATLSTTTGTQAVALMTQADRLILENVRALGHQDTLYLETPAPGTVVRAYVKGSYIAGDVDFIFGGATSVLDDCQIQFVGDRKSSGQALAPDTDARNQHGMLVINSRFTADASTAAGAVGLGRAWDRSCTNLPTYLSTCVPSGAYPNGQAVVRNSTLGPHIATLPWLPAATTKRAYCSMSWACVADAGSCPANRLYEYQNVGPGSAH